MNILAKIDTASDQLVVTVDGSCERRAGTVRDILAAVSAVRAALKSHQHPNLVWCRFYDEDGFGAARRKVAERYFRVWKEEDDAEDEFRIALK